MGSWRLLHRLPRTGPHPVLESSHLYTPDRHGGESSSLCKNCFSLYLPVWLDTGALGHVLLAADHKVWDSSSTTAPESLWAMDFTKQDFRVAMPQVCCGWTMLWVINWQALMKQILPCQAPSAPRDWSFCKWLFHSGAGGLLLLVIIEAGYLLSPPGGLQGPAWISTCCPQVQWAWN